MSREMYKKLTPRGKRRAVAVKAAETVIYTAIMVGAGYVACLFVHGLQLLMGVA